MITFGCDTASRNVVDGLRRLWTVRQSFGEWIFAGNRVTGFWFLRGRSERLAPLRVTRKKVSSTRMPAEQLSPFQLQGTADQRHVTDIW